MIMQLFHTPKKILHQNQKDHLEVLDLTVKAITS